MTKARMYGMKVKYIPNSVADQKKKLADAGNGLAKQSEKLEKICMSQQELIQELRTIFNDLPERS